MVVVPNGRPFSQSYLVVVCPCGRSLRAGLELAGSSVRCWDCHQTVPVPIPRSPEGVARALAGGLGTVFRLRTLFRIALGALAVVGVLFVPGPGPVVTGALLALGAVGYGVVVRRSAPSGSPEPSEETIGPSGLAVRVTVGLALGLVVMAPWVVCRGGLGRPPALHGSALALGAVLALVVPLALLLTWGPSGPREACKAAARHPVATAAALAVVPLGLLAAEALAVLVTSQQGMFSFFLLDLFPTSEALAPRFGIPAAGNYEFPVVPDPRYVALYGDRLSHGLTLSAALPASLAVPSTVSARPWVIEMSDSMYLLVRVLNSELIVGVWMAALALQAHWLGLIARLDARPSPSG